MAMQDPKAMLGLYDRQSEEFLLAAVLKSEQHADEIIPRVQMEMFGDIVHQYIFGAAVELRRHGHAVSPEGVIAKVRELATKNKLKRKDFVSRQAIDKLMALNTEGLDVTARATTVANMWSLRSYADGVENLVGMIAQRPEPAEFRRELLALLSSVSMRQQSQGDGIYYGFDAGPRLDALLDRLDAGVVVRFAWPWEAFDFVAPLPPGFCGVWGMADGCGKSSVGETVGRHNAMLGYNIIYIATEYEQEVLDQRILSQISGFPVRKIMAGGYDKATRAKLNESRDFWAENYSTLHYLSASGLSMPQIIGRIHSMLVKPDLIIMDYLQDVAYDRSDRGDRNERSNNAMQLFHSTLKSIGCAGFVLSQFTKLGYAVKDPNELNRSVLNLGGPAIAKSQCTGIAVRNELPFDGADIAWDRNGVILEQGTGRKGKHERIVRVKIDKQTLGDPGYCFLGFSSNQVVTDLPPRVVEYLGGNTYARDPQPGEKTLMVDGY